MPWNDNRGGGRGPWGQGPQGGGGGPGGIKPPDLDEILKQMQSRVKGMFPTGGGSKWILGGAAGLALALWLITGIYIIQPTERGVVLRFGEYVSELGEGIHPRFPYPIETVERVQMPRRQINIGDVGRSATNRVSEESLMLTGDENIVDIDFQVFWRVLKPRDFLFNLESVEPTIKAVAESAMREAVGQSKFNTVVTAGRAEIQQRVRSNMQSILDRYGAGVEIMEVTLQNVDPPPQVLDAFRDVQAAAADADRARNEAEKYENSKVPEARGLAAQIIQQAEAYKSQVEAEALGEAARFNSIYEQYRNARGVTRERMFLETMEKVLGPMNKVIIDGKGGGVQPFMALPPDLLKRQNPPAGQ